MRAFTKFARKVLLFWVMAAATEAALKGTSAWFFTGRRLLAKPADDRNQTVDLSFVQGSSKRRHIPLALIDLRVDFGIGQLLGFRRTQILGSDRFSDDRVPTSITVTVVIWRSWCQTASGRLIALPRNAGRQKETTEAVR